VRRALAAVLLGLLVLPASASAHAVLESTTPERGAILDAAPREVVFRFSEGVEGAFGAVRVYDAEGGRVDDGQVRRPRASQVAVGLRGDLGEGLYAATYRVVSSDGHPISGGVTFQVGQAAAGGTTIDELLDQSSAGPVTEVAFGIVRALGYAALALGVGGLFFLLACWRGALAAAAGPEERWRTAADALARRWARVWAIAVAVGVVTAALGLVLQAATAGGTTVWAALEPSVVAEVAETKAGRGWLARLVAWLLFAAVAYVATRRLAGAPALRRVALGADGAAVAGPGRGALLALGAAALVLVATPAFGGHAAVQEPVWLLFPTDVVHVAAMAAWLGGLAALLVLVPVATRALQPGERTGVLAGALGRFSPIALAAVAALAATGVTQAIVHLERLGDLLDTAFGRSVLIKSGLLLVLVGLGALNRQRHLPRLRALAAGDDPPGAAGRALRTALRAEVGLVVAVLGVTAALVSYPPPTSLAQGPVTRELRLGPAEVQLTVDPARPGPNQMHLYLVRPADGAPYTQTKEMRVRATLPDKRIGPLDIRLREAGPGHFVAESASLAPAGDWRLELTNRVSEFDEFTAAVEVPVE
jgi:copper transport protein